MLRLDSLNKFSMEFHDQFVNEKGSCIHAYLKKFIPMYKISNRVCLKLHFYGMKFNTQVQNLYPGKNLIPG
jgi:hypothetical protein